MAEKYRTTEDNDDTKQGEHFEREMLSLQHNEEKTIQMKSFQQQQKVKSI
jgi:hypothetical protein